MGKYERFVDSVSRRKLLKASAVAAGVGLVTGSGSALATPTGWDDLPLKQQLSVAQRATKHYKHLDAMDEAGYVSASLALLCSEGYHFDNETLWESNELDPERPESLFYMLHRNGKLSLGGSEFIVVTELDEEGEPVDPKPDLFNDDDEPVDGDVLRGVSEEDGWMLIEDPATGLVIWDLHVWLHEYNPAGVFSLPNPRFEDMPGCVPLEDVL